MKDSITLHYYYTQDNIYYLTISKYSNTVFEYLMLILVEKNLWLFEFQSCIDPLRVRRAVNSPPSHIGQYIDFMMMLSIIEVLVALLLLLYTVQHVFHNRIWYVPKFSKTLILKQGAYGEGVSPFLESSIFWDLRFLRYLDNLRFLFIFIIVERFSLVQLGWRQS